jgi:predicted DNA-binding transcriptional regulator AlpA
MSSELLTVSEAARWAHLSESALNKFRLTGTGPRFIRLGRAIRYRQADLEAWVEAGAANSTSEYERPARFPDDIVRSAVVSARNVDFVASYLDPAAWDAQTRTITARTETARRKLCERELLAVFADLGVTVGSPAGVQP